LKLIEPTFSTHIDTNLTFTAVIVSLINVFFYIEMKKDLIVSKIEAPQDGSHYVLVAFTDPNAPKSTVKVVAVRQYFYLSRRQ
jgi:hypothetical protein